MPATVESLQEDLRALGVRPGTVLLVHSSLSSMGWVCGGPVAAIVALQQTLGPEGTLVMPGHSTYLTEPSRWESPPVPESWWPIIRETMPAFDPDLSPTRHIGAIGEAFRKQRGVLRSSHPQFSFCARGPRAAEILKGHSLTYGLGKSSTGTMIRQGKVALADCELMRQRDAVDFAVSWLESNRGE